MLVSVCQKFDQEHYVYIHVCSALLCRLAAPCVISDCPIAGCVVFFSSASIEWLRLERILQCPQGLLPCPILCNSTETNPAPTQLNCPPFLYSQGPFAPPSSHSDPSCLVSQGAPGANKSSATSAGKSLTQSNNSPGTNC